VVTIRRLLQLLRVPDASEWPQVEPSSALTVHPMPLLPSHAMSYHLIPSHTSISYLSISRRRMPSHNDLLLRARLTAPPLGHRWTRCRSSTISIGTPTSFATRSFSSSTTRANRSARCPLEWCAAADGRGCARAHPLTAYASIIAVTRCRPLRSGWCGCASTTATRSNTAGTSSGRRRSRDSASERTCEPEGGCCALYSCIPVVWLYASVCCCMGACV
jgi:hypothetical protein